jgi:ribosomal protein L37E
MTGGTGVPILKKAIILFVLQVTNFFGTLGLALFVDPRFAWATVAFFVLFGVLSSSLKCERCGKPIYRNSVQVQGLSFTYWGGLNPFPRRCGQCGFDFASTLKEQSSGESP